MDARVKTSLWVQALIRRCEVDAVPAMVVRRGFDQAGVVIVKVNLLDGRCAVYYPATGPGGARLWTRPLGPDPQPEAEVDAYVARQLRYDPDLWVIEIEDRLGRSFLTEPVEGETQYQPGSRKS